MTMRQRTREALARIAQAKLRLTDAVVIAAAALLLMKATAFVAREPEPAAPPPGAGPSVVTPRPELPAFARVLAFARSETPPREVVTTGSNPENGEGDAAGGVDATAPADGAPTDAGNGGLSPDLLPDLRSPATSSEDMLRQRMAEQRAELERRLRELDMREELVAAAEARLEERVAGGPAGAPAPGGTPGAAAAAPEAEDPANAEAMRRLVSMYEAMRPKDAARVFDRLALEVLVPLAVDMSPRRMAEVMAQMSPEAAERLTIALAMRARGATLAGGRQPATTNALPPTELPAIALPPRP
ncbi:MotE family protein [Salinarimonas chemoclinalis]|uniref:MotE family protein n=1 Tax=Salinarimonas chemoclinalis TaxID=3241599 RepID=UPI003557D985